MEVRRQDIHNSEIPLVCRACEARHGGVCGALTAEQLVELNRHSSRHRLETGAEVIGQGETVVNYSNIMRGVVKLTKVMADGRQQIVGLQFAPDFLGRPFLEESAITAEAARRSRASSTSSPPISTRKASTSPPSTCRSRAPTSPISSG